MNKIKSNFWYVLCTGSYASGMWCPFETKEEAINYVKEQIKKEDKEILFEGIDKDNDYSIKVEAYEFHTYTFFQRKDNKILKQEYAE